MIQEQFDDAVGDATVEVLKAFGLTVDQAGDTADLVSDAIRDLMAWVRVEEDEA